MQRNALSGLRDEAMFWPYATFLHALHGVPNISHCFNPSQFFPPTFPKINRRLEVLTENRLWYQKLSPDEMPSAILISATNMNMVC